MKINKETKLYGSFSNNPGNNGCIFFNDAFERYNINAIYKSYYSTDAKALIQATKHLNFSGFALSMPLKIDIIKYIDELDLSSSVIGAVNTVVNNNGKLTGYNTDWMGVKNYLLGHIEDLKTFNNKLTILGNGGFSKAIQYTCKQLNIKFDVITRDRWNEVQKLTGLVFNATPVDVKLNDGILIDGRPFTEKGKIIANLQAKEQFYLYTGIKIL